MDAKDQAKWIVVKDGQRVAGPTTKELAESSAAELRTRLQESAKPGTPVPSVDVKQNIMG